ncbi:conserved hypothetical protein [Catenulispora acidiphila DSM 44928]|uniref:DUF2127 domain-containing protein n=1 Tax=Catenulispora acidiphila (strain DSM 44928 / JCM 14897 / NBRC 102108 / NRRL B-24433 / ID139908) TaxID=479433 RepID=C7Q7A0_CATAD|nr:DUF2127 domain-containing protein [Catenulispora acidiphila]ACU70188.1 conserved hypothetical protein [Catenulispora acidiphila DSM 44928]
MRDWNRRHCARRGHETYAPVGSGLETELAARLRVETVHGPAWRCLRCGDFVIGEPTTGSGPADEAPIVPRGKALRDLFILRLLAVERVIRGVVILLIAWAVWKFGSSQNAVQRLFESDLSAFKPFANHFGWDVEHASIVERIRKTFDYKPKTIHTVALLLGGYALLETVEGVGLWLAKRWGEYLTAVGTSIFLPLEIWDGYTKIHEHKSYILAICTFAINVGAVVYLLLTKRLFGIRGGGEAFEAAKHADALMTVELAACNRDLPEPRSALSETVVLNAPALSDPALTDPAPGAP